MDLHLLPTIIGFLGGFAVLASFAGSATGRLSTDGATYQLLNLGGALGMVVSGLAAGAWPSISVNAIWAGISVYGLLAVRRARRPAGPVVFEPPTAELRLPTAEHRRVAPRPAPEPVTAELAIAR